MVFRARLTPIDLSNSKEGGKIMNQVPTFFVPAATPETQESVYVGFAEWCKCSLPKLEHRVYSITYIHDGEEWTATVGGHLHGIRRRTSRSRGKTIEGIIRLSDPALVLAIFPGEPFMVVTNHRIAGNVGSAWENPFFAGQPTSVACFTVDR